MPFENLAKILAKINDGVCVLDRHFEVQFVNERASQILEADDPGFRHQIQKIIADQAPDRFEHFHASLHRWFEHQTYPNEDGGITLVSRDITSRHRLEEALRTSEERFRRLIESNIIGVVVTDSDEITEANDVFLKMVGYGRSDLVTRQLHWRQMTPPEYDDRDANARLELRETGVFSSYEKEFIHSTGVHVPVSVAGLSLGGGSSEALCLVLDLTERRRSVGRIRTIVEASKILASSLESEITSRGRRYGSWTIYWMYPVPLPARCA